jgi:type I restriction enzyme R subunit
MNDTMSINDSDDESEEKTDEDIILDTLRSRKMLPNASYFAFTATPKNKTLELF